MNKKLVLEALQFWGPLTAKEVQEKASMRGIDLNIGFVEGILNKMEYNGEIESDETTVGKTYKSRVIGKGL